MSQQKNNRVLNSVQIRCHNLICGFGHTCLCLEDLRERRSRPAINFFHMSADNALHRLIPRKLKTKFSQPFSRTRKRLNSLIPFTTLLINNSVTCLTSSFLAISALRLSFINKFVQVIILILLPICIKVTYCLILQSKSS